MQPHAILVLGMHRSGTSALTGALVQLGIDAPRTLIPPDASNELGYWESAPIGQYNDRLLRTLGTSWDAWTPVSVDAFPPRETYARELATLVAQEYGSSARFVVKDPRLCRLVPFWVDVLTNAGVRPTCVIIMRSPAEVARSLAVRDGLPPNLSALLWLRHMLDAEAATRTMPRSIVRYSDLLADWPSVLGRIATDLDLDWPAHALDPDQPAGRYLRPQLRHHVVVGTSHTDMPSPVSEWLEAAVSVFDRLAAGEVFDHARILDDIRTRLDQAAASFGMSADGLRASERRAFAQAQVERCALEESVSALAGDMQTLRHDVLALHERCIGAQERATELEAERDHLRQDLSRLGVQRDQLTRQLEAASHERDTCSGRLHDLDAIRQQVEARAGELDAQLAAARHHLDAVLASGSWRVTAPARAVLTAWQRLAGSKASQTGR